MRVLTPIPRSPHAKDHLLQILTVGSPSRTNRMKEAAGHLEGTQDPADMESDDGSTQRSYFAPDLLRSSFNKLGEEIRKSHGSLY